MAPEDSGHAQPEDNAPQQPKRIWDAVRQCWVEAHTFCRNPLGQWSEKGGNEPDAQLVLFPPPPDDPRSGHD